MKCKVRTMRGFKVGFGYKIGKRLIYRIINVGGRLKKVVVRKRALFVNFYFGIIEVNFRFKLYRNRSLKDEVL